MRVFLQGPALKHKVLLGLATDYGNEGLIPVPVISIFCTNFKHLGWTFIPDDLLSETVSPWALSSKQMVLQ
jgi:hypothetical protein